MSIHAAEAASTDAAYASQEEAHGIEPRRIGGTVMEMKNITLRIGGVTAIKDISFDIKEHEIRAIIGPNGAGKSSMLNVINGFYHPQEGEIWFHGKKRGPMKPYEIAQQGIARTFQNIALFKGMTTLDNIMTGRMTMMKTSFWSQAMWWGAAQREEVEHRRMNVEEKEDMCRFILDVNDEFGTTIALIEHDMGVVMDIADRVVVLDYGRKIGDGTPEEVRANQDVIDAYLGVSHD